MNDALAFPALGLLVHYQRFRDLHLAHHHDPTLTDPYDDPGYQLSRPGDLVRAAVGDAAVLAANNTLLGRMLIGPFVGMLVLWRTDAGLIASDHRAVARAWLLHVSRSFPSRHGSGSSAAFR